MSFVIGTVFVLCMAIAAWPGYIACQSLCWESQ